MSKIYLNFIYIINCKYRHIQLRPNGPMARRLTTSQLHLMEFSCQSGDSRFDPWLGQIFLVMFVAFTSQLLEGLLDAWSRFAWAWYCTSSIWKSLASTPFLLTRSRLPLVKRYITIVWTTCPASDAQIYRPKERRAGNLARWIDVILYNIKGFDVNDLLRFEEEEILIARRFGLILYAKVLLIRR